MQLKAQKPFLDILSQISGYMLYNHSGKPDGIGSSVPNGTYVLPFPGPILQVARVWLISSLTMDILSGLVIWISFIKMHTKWILGTAVLLSSLCCAQRLRSWSFLMVQSWRKIEERPGTRSFCGGLGE